MASITLTEEELQQLQHCLNNNLEPPQEMAQKLFPSLHAASDFKTLKNSRIPTQNNITTAPGVSHFPVGAMAGADIQRQ